MNPPDRALGESTGVQHDGAPRTWLVWVHARLNQPYAHWQACFEADREARRGGGVMDVFHGPVVGEQAVVFALRTTTPRLVHDMMYHPAMRPAIEASGLVVGSERITLCEAQD